eukprot:m.17282 g.17282  ORF g.17282 m.17282 type:complete len:72 (+) comp8254_c0_seq1:32-247(+)
MYLALVGSCCLPFDSSCHSLALVKRVWPACDLLPQSLSLLDDALLPIASGPIELFLSCIQCFPPVSPFFCR